MTAVYNEVDEYAAAWLRNLISAGHIAPGDVDTRSIVDVGADDYKSYTQVHLFAGIGGWSLAARIAGWPDDKPLWTGSCPCQPFSAAGKRKGTSDARHLWPEMRRLVAACRPDVVAGEQVASADGRLWLAGVRADLEDMAYEPWAADLCSAGTGAPHIRQRIWWLADANRGAGEQGRSLDGGRHSRSDAIEGAGFGRCCMLGGVGDTGGARGGRDARAVLGAQGESDSERRIARGLADESVVAGDPCRMVDADQPGSQGWGERLVECAYQWPPGQANLAVLCTDGKTRRFKPGAFPLAHGVSGRVGKLRAAGNAINPWLAAEVLGAYLDGEVLRLKPSGAFA